MHTQYFVTDFIVELAGFVTYQTLFHYVTKPLVYMCLPRILPNRSSKIVFFGYHIVPIMIGRNVINTNSYTQYYNFCMKMNSSYNLIATIFSIRNPQKSFCNLLMVFYRIYCTIILDWISTLLSNTVLLSSFANTERYLFRLVVKNTQKTQVWLTIAGQISNKFSSSWCHQSLSWTSTNAFPCSTLFSDFLFTFAPNHLSILFVKHFIHFALIIIDRIH